MNGTSESVRTLKHRYGNPWIWLIVILALIVGVPYYLSFRNPLPSDEEMIAHLQMHRADIEELIRRYRAYEPPSGQPHSLWKEQGDTPELIRRAGIRQLEYADSPWLPNPYSVETGRYRKSMPEKLAFEKYFKYAATRISLADDPRYPRYTKGSLLYMNTIWKDFYFIPEVPRIVNGVLHGPVDSTGQPSPNYRVLPSLNDFPKDWARAECVMRQIEPQWFITMCRI